MVLITQIHSRQYKNKDAAKKLIEYITRTRENEDRAHELICFGDSAGYHHGKTPAQLICEYHFIHNTLFHKTGSLMMHFSIEITLNEFRRLNNDWSKLADYAVACCQYIYKLEHQCCFAIHHTQKPSIHIHLAVNTVSYLTDHKFSQYPKHVYLAIEKPLQDLFYHYLIPPTTFQDYLQS